MYCYNYNIRQSNIFTDKANKELILLIELTKHPEAYREDIVIAYLEKGFDWQMFVKLGRRHRLLLPALRKLKLYSSYLSGLRLTRLDNLLENETRKMLVINTELKRISKIFEINGIEFRNLKGPGIAGLLYSDPAERMSRDIDILIDENDISRVINILKENSYEIFGRLQNIGKKHLNVLIRSNNQLQFFNREKRLALEVHWKLFKHSWLPDDINNDFARSGKFVDYSKLSPENVLFLIIHGGMHNWNRLFWLRDIHFIFTVRPEIIGDTEKLARQFRLERLFYPTLQLLNIVYEQKLQIIDIESDSLYKSLSLYCIDRILILEDTSPMKSTIDSIRYKSSLKKSFSHKIKVVGDQFFSSSYINYLHLPGKLMYANYFLAPFIRMGNYFKLKKVISNKR